jgi:hypothetical protein
VAPVATLSEAQVAQSRSLTTTYKAQQNREAAKIAALISLWYMQRVNVEDPASIEAWLDLMVPRLISTSDGQANRAAGYFQAIRTIETLAADFRAEPTLGVIDPGVRKSLLTVGPYDMVNKMREIDRLDPKPVQRQAMLAEAKQVTTKKIAAAAIRHAQAGGRQTIVDNAAADKTALGWIRVTKAEPCFFCAMLASRGVTYRAFKEGSFDLSDPRFTGSGDAKVHDNCGCSLKPVYSKNDPLVKQADKFAEMWSMWGAGGGDAALRFRRGYDHFQETGDYLTWDQANEGLRAA